MEWGSGLKRSQSLKAVTCDKPVFTDVGLWDKRASVSQLVAKYQVEVSQQIKTTTRSNIEEKSNEVIQAWRPHLQASDLKDDIHTNEFETWNDTWIQPKSPVMSRSKSLGSLNTIDTLKSKFEGKSVAPIKQETFMSSPRKSGNIVLNGEKRKNTEDKQSIPIDASVNKATVEKQTTSTAKALQPHQQASDMKDHTNESETWNDTWIQPKSPTSLSRSKSLNNIDTLKSIFEAKSVALIKQETFTSSPRKSGNIVISREKRENDEDEQSIPVEASVAKQTRSLAKVENKTKIQRRKTIGGVDFEMLAKSQAEEKRKSIAEFRDSSEKVCVSVKAISALYLSKVTPQEPTTLVASSELGKRTRLAKMAEDNKDDILPSASEDQSGLSYRATIESMQQRQRKNELKRLLKHTHPEITTLDNVMDKELAAVLKSEAEEAAAETGYEGEVFSKCLIFENCTTSQKGSSYSTNMVQGTSQTPTSVFEEHVHTEPNKELIEEEVRLDVQSTKRRFEEKSMKATQPYQHKPQDNVYNADQVLPDQIMRKSKSNIQESQYKTSDLHFIDKQVCSANLDEDFTSIPEPETSGDAIKTSQDLFRHNPFITVNVEKEHSSFQGTKEIIPEVDIPNVKNRKHLFESMPFDKIKQQNKDDIETMVENIRETLHFLYSANVLQSKGSIIEVHETMIATKVKFILTEAGPEIVQDTVAEGGAQNFILHLLPRANVEPQIKYLKEGRDGAVVIMEVSAPVHPNHPDTEFKTANVVQLIEDILTQDNSLRKGVLIQDQVEQCAQVSVYSLYCYVDNEDIKSYCPSQQAPAEEVEQEVAKSVTIQKEIPQLNSGVIKSTIHCLQESQLEVCTVPERPDITIRGNVKLFRSCIEKGDMEYLKSLQAVADMAEEELPVNSPDNNASDDNAGYTEYEPVDIKRLKGLFSADSIPVAPKPESCTNVSWLPSRSEEKSKKTAKYETQETQGSYTSSFIEDNECIHQAELAEVIDECEEISSLQAAISQLQKATYEAKSIHDSLQERQDKDQANPTALENSTITSPLKTYDSKDISTDQIYEPKTEDEEVVLEGKLQAALQALERSNLNVTRGGFDAAMIYRNSNKISSSINVTPCETTAHPTDSCFECKPTSGLVEQNVGDASASQNVSVMEKSRKPLGPKPALPPKPEHLKAHPKELPAKVQTQNAQTTSANNQEVVRNITDTFENVTAEQKIDKEEHDESHLNFHEACQIFGSKKKAMKKTAPVKPKRVKIAETKSQGQSDSVSPISCTNSGEQRNDGKAKVTMREKKGRTETEDERRQRLSVHMDEIVRGNITAAMEIYDNLRKQEELENILIQVEKIENDTSEVDVKSLKKVFEDVPDWVVSPDTKRNKTEGVQQKMERPKLVKSNSQTKSSMAHVFGDLARASEEITDLKEQTLARLLDIEESIKKALYSVSNLKSESDIAGLSNLFKESLGAAQTASSSGNISTISIGSSRTKTQNNAFKMNENQSGDTELPKQPSPMSSPAFISISAARKTDVPLEITLCPSCRLAPKPEEKFRTTKTLKCPSPTPVRKGGQKQCPSKPKREVSTLEVQTDPKGTKKSLIGTKTITENYERTDNFGNKFYSTKTSTVLTTEPQTSCPVHAVVSPGVKQVSTHPEVRLPVNKKTNT